MYRGNIFSKRQMKLRGEYPDVYQYDIVPDNLRVQIIQIWSEILGDQGFCFEENGQEICPIDDIVKKLRREYGEFSLIECPLSSVDELTRFFREVEEVEKALDVVELVFYFLKTYESHLFIDLRHTKNVTASAAIEELNLRFNEHGVGYRFVYPSVIRIDSEFIHSEAVIPALQLIHQERFKGVQDEFLKAHEHFRKGNPKEALSGCLNAFESVMKVICEERGWKPNGGSTARDLIEVCLKNQLIPDFWQCHFSALRSLLESGVPTGRNKLSGHGQGTNIVAVPGYLASYMIHMTASAIVFLIEADRNL